MRRLVFLCLSAVAAIVPALGQEARYRSSAELVTIDVLVTDDRWPIADLAIADFELLDNGVRQSPQLLYLERLPVVVMMVLDSSGSVEGDRLASLKRAAAIVVDRLRPVDRAAIVTFSHQLGLRAPLTSDRAALHASIAALTADGSTSLRDAAFAGLTLAAVDRARTLMMLFSDGVDTSSLLSDRQVLEIARRSDVTVYPIGIRNAPRLTGIGRTTGGLPTDDRFLRDLAQTTGGRLVYAEETRDLSRTFTRVIDEFNSRYVLGYAPTGVPGRGWHRVEVRLKNRKGTVVSRRGYFADWGRAEPARYPDPRASVPSSIMSPRGLVRNVPLDWRPWRSRSGADGDEYERAATCGHLGAGRGGDVDVEVGGDIDGGELPPSQAALRPLSRGGRAGVETSQRGARVESDHLTAAAPPRVGAHPRQVWR